MNNLKKAIVIGYDPREDEAAKTLKFSIELHNSEDIPVFFLKKSEISINLFYRPFDVVKGQFVDLVDGKPFSTQFSFTRFLIPFLYNQYDLVLFMDCDCLLTSDISELFDYYDKRYAIQVVKHNHVPKEHIKMDGMKQENYSRKNWSSVCLWNLNHLGHNRLFLSDVSTKSGFWLHNFQWLKDEEIGELPSEWNFLVGYYQIPVQVLPKLLHFTLGMPFMSGYENCDYSDIWNKYNNLRKLGV